MKSHNVFLIIFLFKIINISSQNNNILPDSLKKYSYDSLLDKVFSITSKRNKLEKIYAETYLEKAKSENNDRQIIYGYDLLAQINNNYNVALKYSDISIDIAKKKYPKALPFLYITKGNIYFANNKLKESSNCFLRADSCNTKNLILKNKIDYSIGLIKKTQGKYLEALPIYKKCVKNATSINDDNYILYILGLGEIYERINNIKEAEKYITLGIIDCKKNTKNNDLLQYFIANRGKIYFKKNEYKEAIFDLKLSLNQIKNNNDFSNFSENCFYIGECYDALQQQNNAIIYYKKVDSVFENKKNIALLTIPCYNKIIDYYIFQLFNDLFNTVICILVSLTL